MNEANGSRAASQTDLPVLMPAAQQLHQRVEYERLGGVPRLQLKAAQGFGLLGIVLVSATAVSYGQADAQQPGVFSIMVKWTPLLLQGFLFNILISIMAMAIGTIAGAILGIWQISLIPPVRVSSWVVTQFFRNAPWLVLLFFCMFLLPFEIRVFGVSVPLPDWAKATFGLALPVMANISEIVRGAIQSIPSGQWESAESLAFTRWQTLSKIIIPQCIKRMLPPWMNLYAILTMATVLASVVGVSEVMTLTSQVLNAEGGRTDLLIPFYSYILVLFFLYCFPIARLTVRLERRYAVKS